MHDGVIIDTNVLIASDGESTPQATPECVISAIEFLEESLSEKVILLDFGGDILEEYERYCSYSGQPRVRDRFFVELTRRQADVSKVRKVEITPTWDGSYEEVPADLRDFDPSDHKFIASAVADGFRSPIINCVDSDWSHAGDKLGAEGISVIELCPECLKKSIVRQ
ncbi:predicted protein [Streptomyces sp. AA4]|nr:predicted protein [Streptomyces sp. AA4]